MSGGHFDYKQGKLLQIAEDINELIATNENTQVDEWGDTRGRFFKKETITEFRNAVFYLNAAYTYAQRIDWLVSGDDSEETFHKRLKEDLDKI